MRPLLRPYQSRVFRALEHGIRTARGATFTVLFPRQAGKNEVSATLVAYLLFEHGRRGGSIVVCAPTFAPQAAMSMDRTLDIARRRGLECSIARNSIRHGRASAIFLGASPEAHVAGHTASIVLVADEAQEIDQEWFDRQFRPMAASTGAPTVMFGTPWDGETMLDRAVAANRRLHPERHFDVTWQEVAGYLPAYGDYVRAERERLGPDHHIFRTQYELVAGQPEDSLLDVRQIENLRGSHPRLGAPRAGERYVAGLDVGGDRERSDASVLTAGRVTENGVEVVDHRAWQGVPQPRIAREVAELHDRWRFARIVVDATGIGAVLATMLEEQRSLPVERLHFSAASKSRLGIDLVAAANTRRLKLYRDDGSPEWRTCMAELRSCRARWQPGGLLAWGDDRGHDDYAVSLALCLHAAGGLGAPRVAVGKRRA